MECLDLDVLQTALTWREAGFDVSLATVVQTWGSAPRPPGSLLAIRSDGQVLGSVSGGCIEDDLIARVRNQGMPEKPEWVQYGVTRAQAQHFGLPCGGILELVLEPVTDSSWIAEVLQRTSMHELVQRTLVLASGAIMLSPGQPQSSQSLFFDGEKLTMVFGPQLRLLMIGAGQLSQIVAQMAQPLGFDVLMCDPREEYTGTWQPAWGRHIAGMPDDVVLQIKPDAHTAIVALTHDPKLDDMALLEALKSAAFYVGALGSRANNKKRRERLALFDLSDEQIEHLHGPIGLHIGSRTPAEIAISILAEIISVKNGVIPSQKKLID
ncbi:XdhC family protein [Solimicrobium silvestre]|uniref:Xanthine and CO dehydrogenases maturation factor XdhC/CoxF family n=1 Tax=Solimicrobium silvestre TaxID=2099400 RepID=A0A2S9GV44_9BURK|nr:XdhC family protein [Solimicrobium silvestre]PRC91583.1 Xanthine and CO dehydrogenases maturation factor XdhC/CoxF family [Solimicrobium silvestre]